MLRGASGEAAEGEVAATGGDLEDPQVLDEVLEKTPGSAEALERGDERLVDRQQAEVQRGLPPGRPLAAGGSAFANDSR